MDDVLIIGFDHTTEFRHNGEALGRVRSLDGSVEVFHEVPHADARFWIGLKAWTRRRRVVVPIVRRSALSGASSRPTG